jgi:hypothetical protein
VQTSRPPLWGRGLPVGVGPRGAENVEFTAEVEGQVIGGGRLVEEEAVIGDGWGEGMSAAEAVVDKGVDGLVVVSARSMSMRPMLHSWRRSLIKAVYCFHQKNDDSKCEAAHTSPAIRP